MFPARQTIMTRPAALWAVSIAAALLVGLMTSSLFGVGLFLVLPGVVLWLMRRT